MIRKPCVAGMFYESDKNQLKRDIEEIFSLTKQDIPKKSENSFLISAGIVPHAGYIYSGKTASYTFKNIAEDGIYDTIIIIGPNHTGLGDKISLSDSDKWETPLGYVEIDKEFNNLLEQTDPNITFSQIAHTNEHSIEVELPFLQYIAQQQNKKFKIVPIIITKQTLDLCIQLAYSIEKVTKLLNKKCMIIASTDLTHYETSQSAKNKDQKVLDSIKQMDIEQLIKNINQYHITMCGYGPVITAMFYSKLVNSNNAEILNYSNSGDAFGDYESVVGYGSAIIKKIVNMKK